MVTAVATSPIARTWRVRLPASSFTLLVRSRQTPAAPGTSAWPPSLPSTPTSRATPVTWSANVDSVTIMSLMVSTSVAISPLGVERQLLIEVAVGDRGDDARDAAHLLGQVARHDVHVVGQVPPDARDAAHLGLAAEHAFGADLARDARHLGGERVQLIDHRVDGVLQLEELALAPRP